MGRRHSKNAGGMGSEALTYHERRALGFGTVRERLGRDSHGNYYDCRLTLQPAVDPVVTPGGVLYSREAILESLLQQKKAAKRRLAEWEAEQRTEAEKAAARAAADAEARLVAFDRANHMGARDATAEAIRAAVAAEAAAAIDGGAGAKSVVTNADNVERMKGLNAFWVPSKAPEAKASKERPDDATRCPASGAKLKLKDLIAVKFTAAPDRASDGGGGGGGGGEEASGSGAGGSGGSAAPRHIDPITRDALTNASRLVVLAPTGDVMLRATYEKCVKPDGSYRGKKIGPKDAIELVGGGTGFAARDGDRAEARHHWLLGPGSGKAPLRGQHQGPRSSFGLNFTN